MAEGGVTVNVTTNFAEVAKDIQGGTDAILKMLPVALKEYVVTVCRDLLDKSYPAPGGSPREGGTNTTEGLESGKASLAAEINRAFTTWDKSSIGDLIMAKNEAVLWNVNNPIAWRSPRLAKAWNSQDINTLYGAFKAAGWVEGGSSTPYEDKPTEAMHESMRDKQTGRILDEVRNNKNLRISVRDRQAIEAYILTKQRSVGTMAGGWVKALTALGSPVSTPFGNNGHGGAEITNGGLTIHAYNELGDFNGMLSNQGIIEAIVRERGEDLKAKLDSEIERLLNESAKTK